MARRRPPRGVLSQDDRAIWEQVARSVRPMADRPTVKPPPPAQPPPADQPKALSPQPRAVLLPPGAFRIGYAAAPQRRALPPPASPAERLSAATLRMDAGTHRDLVRGRLRPEARIDLHGMTLAVAKAELTGFILSARASGRRLVLVITGKGKGDHGPLPFRSGALRHEVPHWLTMPPVAAAVMQIVPAHFRHGGAGAYYVYLRRAGRD